ncbi:MAG: c-type cytochrome [Opitutales bacterium]
MRLRGLALSCALLFGGACFTACSDSGSKEVDGVGEAPLVISGMGDEVSWSYEKVSSLPSEQFTFDEGSYFSGQTVKIVRLSELWKAVDPGESADTMTAYCKDKYFSVYTRDWVDTYKPFIIIEVEGKAPREWTGTVKNAAPYFISFDLEEGMPPYQHASHKRPWGVESVTFGNYSEMFSVFYEEPFADLKGPALEGRDVWINSCASCHEAPGNGIGGHKAVRPWEVLAVHAKMNVQYFKKYVHDPKSLNPAAQMEPHPHITEAQLNALVAFLTTGS